MPHWSIQSYVHFMGYDSDVKRNKVLINVAISTDHENVILTQRWPTKTPVTALFPSYKTFTIEKLINILVVGLGLRTGGLIANGLSFLRMMKMFGNWTLMMDAFFQLNLAKLFLFYLFCLTFRCQLEPECAFSGTLVSLSLESLLPTVCGCLSAMCLTSMPTQLKCRGPFSLCPSLSAGEIYNLPPWSFSLKSNKSVFKLQTKQKQTTTKIFQFKRIQKIPQNKTAAKNPIQGFQN